MGVIIPAVLLASATIIAWLLYKHLRMRQALKHLNQPRSYPIVGHGLVTKPDPEGFMNQVIGMGYLYPDPRMCLLWIGPFPCLMLYSADLVEPIFSSTKHLNKGFAYVLLEPWLGISILTSQKEQWRPKRKLLTPTFHYDILKDFLPIFNEQSKILVQKMCSLGAEEEVDVLSVITLCTLDIICETSMGKAIGAQLAENNEYVWAVHTINKLISKRTNNPLMWNSFIYNLTEDGRTHEKCLRILHDFTKKVIVERKEALQENDYKMEGRLAFLDLLLEMVKSGQMDETDVQAEVDTFMFEGHDTTSTGLMWAIHLLGNHPEVQRKVQAELDEVMGDDEDVTIEHLSRMKYLECALKEALRLFPSVPIITRELSDDQVIGGVNIPKGVTFLLNLYLVHRDPSQWKDPDVFDPDRFLPENSIARKSFAFIPFSAGSRNCIGQRFALMEEKVIMAHLLRNFNVKAVELMHEVRPKMEIIVRPVTPIHMKLTRRRPIVSP
ncbi:CYtochrome P450 family [Caenorhabditis elegans]|uniref:CYtochrome P450 family n=1 Tax=Caenorhabditis elegans TaxID=6239 RepID=Q9N574_CAEEL|nr:CYtochrome P450 family [Caenorhabditis elegans]CCD68717.1 CYtochrome P450 family [Caenorhabditis elegans]|eukprot:NP_500637.2 CYtochrome P450 family [Caenorhabditis elegans]